MSALTPADGRPERIRRPPDRYGFNTEGVRQPTARTPSRPVDNANEQGISGQEEGNEGTAPPNGSTTPGNILSRVLSYTFGNGKRAKTASVVSNASRRAEAELEAEERLNELLDERSKWQNEMDLAEFKLTRNRLALKRLLGKIEPENPTYDQEKVPDLTVEIQTRTEELEDLEILVKEENIVRVAKLAKIDREIKFIKSELTVRLNIIDEDEDQNVGSEDEGGDVHIIEGDKGQATEEEMRERLKLLTTNYGNPPPPDSVFDEVKMQPVGLNLFAERVTEMLGELKSGGSSSVTAEQVLIRQSMEHSLPDYHGDPEDWYPFISTYRNTTKIGDFKNSDNLQRLQMHLKGAALQHVKALLASPENVGKIIQRLEDRFGQPELVIQSMITGIRALPQVKSDQPSTLINFGTAVSNLVETIKSMDKKEDLINPALLREFKEKLPLSMRGSWDEKIIKGTKQPHLQNFADWLDMKVQVACLNCPPTKPADKKEERSRRQQEGGGRVQISGEITAAGLLAQPVKKGCVFCKRSNHPSSKCYAAEGIAWEEKRKRIRKGGVCYVCLGDEHLAKDCDKPPSCEICKGKHPKPLCPNLPANKRKETRKEGDSASSGGGGGSTTLVPACLSVLPAVLAKTVVVKAMGPGGEMLIRLIFDGGAHQSYMTSSTLNKIQSKRVGEEKIRHMLFGGGYSDEEVTGVYEVQLGSLDGKFKRSFQLREKKKVCGTIIRVPPGPWVSQLQKRSVFLSDFQHCAVDEPDIHILIGVDYEEQLRTGKTIRLDSGLVGVETLFGWYLCGKLPKGHFNPSILVSSLLSAQMVESALWGMEALGIRDPGEHKQKEQREKEAMNHFMSTVARDGEGRYRVHLPWVEKKQLLPTNKEVAKKRLLSTTNKLVKNGDYDAYDKIFKSWEGEGILDVVQDEGIVGHFLPHRPVYKLSSSTTPIRPVFDASCKVGRSPSLNDCLEKGPNLLELIPSLIIKFRLGPVGVTADIRKAFQQIEVSEEDKNYQCFLWWKEKDRELMIYRHKRVVFGITCSPFLLGAVVHSHLSQAPEEVLGTAKRVMECLYADNVVTSLSNLGELEVFREQSTKWMEQGKMVLTQWESNLIEDDKPVTSVLGMGWDKIEDVVYCVSPEIESLKYTKREVLSIIQRVFDPMGFLSPATIRAKILLQKAWGIKIGWDDELPSQLKEEFREWVEEIQFLETVKIPRRMSILGGVKSYQLHCFSDASKHAYAAVIFMRAENDTGDVTLQLIQSKSRVAPLKMMSIPRLELMGCLISSRLATEVMKSLGLGDLEVRYWTDSSTALAWIKRRHPWGTFVSKRVEEINNHTQPEQWRFVNGTLNPADLPSRGSTPLELLQAKWNEGPIWLREPKESWPTEEGSPDDDLVNSEERKTVTMLGVGANCIPWYVGQSNYFSKNVRIMAIILRWLKGGKEDMERDGAVTSGELKKAEMRIFKLVQDQSFEKDRRVIEGLSVFRDEDGFYKVKTKILELDDTEIFRTPILLPHDHPAISQLIRKYHILNKHAGVKTLKVLLREEFWIIRDRRAIEKVVNKCHTCRKFNARAPSVPPAPLPRDRVNAVNVFEVVGADLAGPLTLKSRKKVWIVVFTCAVYRALHLELVDSLTTESFILALIRFMSRRGRPSTIYTDNGGNFRGSANVFENLEWDEIRKDMRLEKITWKFNPPSAPWWGGWFEIMVKMTKQILRKVLGQAKLNYVELETSLCEAEAVINSRPLTHAADDTDDLAPLTPNMFLRGIQGETFPEVEALDDDGFRGKFRKLDDVRRQLRQRFRNEYLSQLVHRGKNKKIHHFKVGDLVLVEVDNIKRVLWPMARIEELPAGGDGKNRVAWVKTKSGRLLRPLQRLFPLELSNQEAININTAQAPYKATDFFQDEPIKTRSGRVVKKPERMGISG